MKARSKDPYVDLAWRSVEAYVRRGATLQLSEILPAEMRRPAATFVSLKVDGRLRGCIGTLSPVQDTVAEEIVSNAIKSASEDPRFPPVSVEELDVLDISVDVLGAPEPCTLDDLDPLVYGVIVTSGYRRGVLLPDLEGIDTVEDQVFVARRKAGIPSDTPLTLHRFTVRRHL